MKEYNYDNKSNSIVYSGVSIGLPGVLRKAFADDNFDTLFEGKNLIEKLSIAECESMLELNITRLIKSEAGAVFKTIETLNEVIQLAGKFGKLDMINDYLIDEKVLNQMAFSTAAAVAAGYEALNDAGIPLTTEFKNTSCNTKLPGRLVLPLSMQEGTGIIFASAFSFFEPFIEEVSRFVAYKYSNCNHSEIVNFYASIITKLSDPSSRKILTDWFVQYYSSLGNNVPEQDLYKFNHNFLTRVSSHANNRLAQFVNAKGPNFQIGAACSSTAYAITIAESFIKAGQADRMIIIGAEMPASKTLLPWIGGGITSIGAASVSGDVSSAAVPFDNRRNGMLMGSGALGIILEKEDDVLARGMNGICRLIGTHAFNTAGHQSKVDSDSFCIELDRFLTRLEKQYEIDRSKIASKTMYLSHETYASKEGGCSFAEKASLEYSFKDKYSDVLVCNTKGFTGNTMGASIEDAIAAKALQYQKVPPMANYKEPDLELNGLKISTGGSYSFDYVLRTVAGFGGQGNFNMLEKISVGDNRIFNTAKYNSWISENLGQDSFSLNKKGRILVVEAVCKQQVSFQEPVGKEDLLAQEVMEVISEATEFPVYMLDPAMEIYEDIGIDTQQPLLLLSMLKEKFTIDEISNIDLTEKHTVGKLIKCISQMVSTKALSAALDTSKASFLDNTAATLASTASEQGNAIKEGVLRIFSDITTYPTELLDVKMELLSDLGIDSISLAMITSCLEKEYGIVEQYTHSDVRTIGDVISFVEEFLRSK
ncbi:MAG: beta-ketoacyl synthase N-terminal-like domain-containing protein [Ruminiclostridium sp.]